LLVLIDSIWLVLGSGVDVWPSLLSRAKESPRAYLPTTEHSIIWKGQWKLLNNAGGSGWYPPALGFNDPCIAEQRNGTEGFGCASDPHEWPCVGPTNAFIYPSGLCQVCSAAKPCLFDILADPGEKANLAHKSPAIVNQLSKALAGYVGYVPRGMSPQELEPYECLNTSVNGGIYPSPWWGNFSGPCCRPK